MKKLSWLYAFIQILYLISVLRGHGSAVHMGQYEKVLQYYLNHYGSQNSYYQIMLHYPEYVKFGANLPDMNVVNSGKPTLQNLYDRIYQETGHPLTYQINLDEVPDPEDPDIGTHSFGIDTHDPRYAFHFAQYLLEQANLVDPPGIDPGGTGIDAVSRAQKLALAIGYYLHLCQDISAHNFWIPLKTTQSGLAELSLAEPKNTATQIEVVPGAQTHNAIETLHDYRYGQAGCQEVADVIYSNFWYCAGSSGIPVQILNGVTITGQFEPPVGPIPYPASVTGQPELYVGLNPALHFFYQVLQDWHQNNPQGLPEHTSGPLISLKGFIEECHMWRFLNRFYPQIVGHGDFPATFADWISNHTQPTGLFGQAVVNFVDLFIGDAFNEWFRDKVTQGAIPSIEYGASSTTQSFIGIMLNDPSKAEFLASDPYTDVNYAEYLRLKNNPMFTDPNYFSDFTYYEDLGIRYFDQIGPGGNLYSSWYPEYYNAYYWGVINSLNGLSPAYQQRTDIGVFDAFFTVNGERYGPGVEVVAFEGNIFSAVAELYAFRNMTVPLTISAKVYLDHSSGIHTMDYLVKTASTQMQQNPEDYNSIPRKYIEVPFTLADFQGISIEDFRGAYLELSIAGQPFYSTDWKQYAALSQVQGNRRYEEYNTYISSPYSYPQNYLHFKFTNVNSDGIDIGGTVNINGADIPSNQTIPIFFLDIVEIHAEEVIEEGSRKWKFYNWNNIPSDFYLHKIFPANNSPIWHYKIVFREQDDIKLTTHGGNILDLEIKDPWWVEKSGPSSGKQLYRFHSLSEQPGFQGKYSIFPNLPYNPNFPDNPYYQMRASDHFHNLIYWYFKSWSGSDVNIGNSNASQTWVSFDNESAVLNANFKGHLASNTASATRTNGQRKLVYAGGKYHMVYEDEGEIYYTFSNDDGQSWSRENRLSDDSGLNVSPCLAATDDGILAAVWQRHEKIILRIKNFGGQWENPRVFHDIFMTSYYKSIPVITFTHGYFYIVWRDYDPLFQKYELKIRSYEPVQSISGPLWSIDKTSSQSINPSLAADGHGKLHLVWQESGHIYYSLISQSAGGQSYFFPISKECLSKGSGYFDHKYPSIALTNDFHPNVIWQSYSGELLETEIILHRRRTFSNPGAGWHSFTAFLGNEFYTLPSITGFQGVPQNQELRAAWGRGSSYIWNASFDGESWEEIYFPIMSGSEPTLSINLTDEQVSKMLYRSHTSPYRLTTTSERLDPQYNLPVTENLITSTGKIQNRRGVISIDSSEISLELGDIEVDGNPVTFVHFHDSLSLNNNGNWGDVFVTEPFEMEVGSNLQWRSSFQVKDRFNLKKILGKKASIALKFDILDAETQQILKSYEIKKIKQIIPKDTSEYHLIKWKMQSHHKVYFKARFEVSAGLVYRESVVNCRYEEEVTQLTRSVTPDTETMSVIPSKFALFQNYPNPFNPHTRITFDIPRESKVTLSIYNTLGEQITTLISERKPAGRYSYIWNARSTASGIYICHLEAEGFHESKKMILLR
ncbi:MAG: T9SS type A sorting domain-containing protein [bacterium]|nr:MAG: T9SS type A sorting domain-containing protein [bacterium]